MVSKVIKNFSDLKKSNLEKGSIEDFLFAYLKLNETSFGNGETDFSSIERQYFDEFSNILFISKLYDIERPKSITYQLLKIKSLFYFFYKKHKYIVDEFYTQNNILDPDIWFSEILIFLSNQNLSKISYVSVTNSNLKNYFNKILINNHLDKETSLETIKRNPIFQINDNYLILDWNFFFIGFYYKVNFDLLTIYNKKIKKISYPDYKSIMSKKISEEILFRYIIRKIAPPLKNHISLVFDSEQQGFPDCYLRVGNKVYVIEFKDYNIEDKVLESYDLSLIKKQLDDKFVSKGVNQLSKFIKTFSSSENIFDLKISAIKQKLEFIPIIVVSEDFFSLPSFENYLSKRFAEISTFTDKKVNGLVVISVNEILNFLMSKVDANFFKLIHEYSKNKKSKIRQKTSLFKFPDFKHKNEHGKENLEKLLIDIFKDFPVTDNPSILNSNKNKN
ncbi:hypothetical protein [Chryseobacterium shandongense]|uniref:hypothetical protein n=1 Tax=Chryseobacterium shandongense TaxID=1493872 RepID=UPI000F4EDA4F|nr:hypothetical protein [Chryseobacterium shandongense]AZA58669.1 hypothetical protein EG350_16395 [Chryseobacterium shandongense]